MKKLIYTLLSLLFLVTSCSLDKLKSGTIDTERAVESVQDASNIRNYLYLRLRGMYSGSYIYFNELSTDIFHASNGYGNRGGTFYRWEWVSTESLAETFWSYNYYTSAVSNFLLQKMEVLDKTNLSNIQKDSLAIFAGECHFLKAITMFELAQRYSDAYTPQNASTSLGVMLVDSYAPTSDPEKYPARSSLADTYTFIDQNMTKAAEALKNVKGTVGSMFLTSDAVTAMQARIALIKGEYDTAIRLSTELIAAGKYPLINNDSTKFANLWTNDSGEECMMQLYADYTASSLPSSLSYGYINKDATGLYTPDFILEQWIVDLYNTDDVRFKNWIKKRLLTYGTITGNAYILTKFPGNPALQDPTAKTSSYLHKIKLFRIAEQYLIAAEAYAHKGNDALASKYLNDLRANRIENYIAQDYAGSVLLNEIAKERVREFIGEGFRFLDLKRTKTGFERSKAQNTDIISNAGGTNTEFLKIDASNFRFLWPIPQAEIDANPQIKNQQNNGY